MGLLQELGGTVATSHALVGHRDHDPEPQHREECAAPQQRPQRGPVRQVSDFAVERREDGAERHRPQHQPCEPPERTEGRPQEPRRRDVGDGSGRGAQENRVEATQERLRLFGEARVDGHAWRGHGAGGVVGGHEAGRPFVAGFEMAGRGVPPLSRAERTRVGRRRRRADSGGGDVGAPIGPLGVPRRSGRVKLTGYSAGVSPGFLTAAPRSRRPGTGRAVARGRR